MSKLKSNKPTQRIAEAQPQYHMGVDENKLVKATISSKNQITLPAKLLRELGLVLETG